ncbi:hypothetical protein JCM3765_001409 [Sporobolomyces pararoseus]
MTAVSTLAYGITVQAVYLLTAALAWPNLIKSFMFIDLVLLRRRNGTLSDKLSTRSGGGTGGGSIAKVPVEVWEKIRKMVVGLETKAAEARFLSKHWTPCRISSCRLARRVESWDSIELARTECASCSRGPDCIQHEFSLANPTFFNPIHTFVADFGLAHPLSQTIPDPAKKWNSLADIALVALPLQLSVGTRGRTTITANAGWVELPDQHTLVDVNLNLPPDADLRFIRLVQLFSLPVVESSISTLEPADPHEISKARLRSNQTKKSREDLLDDVVGVRNERTNEIKPRWKLYTTCYTNSSAHEW